MHAWAESGPPWPLCLITLCNFFKNLIWPSSPLCSNSPPTTGKVSVTEVPWNRKQFSLQIPHWKSQTWRATKHSSSYEAALHFSAGGETSRSSVQNPTEGVKVKDENVKIPPWNPFIQKPSATGKGKFALSFSFSFFMCLDLSLTLLKSSHLLLAHVQIHEFSICHLLKEILPACPVRFKHHHLIYPLMHLIYISIKHFILISYLNIAPLLNQLCISGLEHIVKVGPCYKARLIACELPQHFEGLLLGPVALDQHYPPNSFSFFLEETERLGGFCIMDKQSELIWLPNQEELKEQRLASADHNSVWPRAMEILKSSGSKEDSQRVETSHDSMWTRC